MAIPFLIISLINSAVADTLVSVDAEYFEGEVYSTYYIRKVLPTGFSLGASVNHSTYGTEATPTIGYLWEPDPNYTLEVTLDKYSLQVDIDARF